MARAGLARLTGRLTPTALVALALVLVGTAVAAFVVRPEPVYWARADVVFLPPEGAGNALEGEDDALVPFAAAVERAVVGGPQELVLASDGTPLYGEGVRAAATVRLARTGGQWQASFDQPLITVQVVMPTRDGAAGRLEDVLARVEAAAVDQQDGVGASERVRTERSPAHPQITRVVGSATRSVLGVLGVGALLAALVVVADRRGGRGRSGSGGPA